MPFFAKVMSVFVASPGDTSDERDAIEAAIRSWNSDYCLSKGIILLPLRWELDATPQLGSGSAQDSINRELVDRADIIVAMFKNRLGKPTSNGLSGTAEEIEKGIERGLYTHVFFSAGSFPRNVDPAQVAALQGFRARLESAGIIGEYMSPEDLASKARSALARDVEQELQRKVGDYLSPDDTEQGGPGWPARIVPYIADNILGNLSLGLRNSGRTLAEDVEILVEPIGDGSPPGFLEPLIAERIHPGDSVHFTFPRSMGMAPSIKVRCFWKALDQHFKSVDILQLY
ncbi:DUF4062 domain-containing protein [Streptomyces sp. NPDC086989]|uniref:DUF4062 domain-containing protein n=1 Tax=Streptomyces sp. NPDC086989 TaxID=3365764 RepID=UPI0038117987